VTTEIRKLERQVDTVASKLEPLLRDLYLHQARLERLTELYQLQGDRLRFLRSQYELAVERLNKRLVALYESDEYGTLEVILSAKSLTQIIDELDFLKLMVRQDRDVAREVREAREQTKEARAHTRATRKQVSAATRVIEYRASEVQAVRDRLLEDRSALDEQRAVRSGKLDKLSAAEQEAVGEAEALAKVSAQLADKIRAAQGSTPYTAHPPSASGFIWPVSAGITSGFGMRWGRMHEGLDLGASYGTPIHAAAAGTVINCGWLGGYGNLVVIDHGGRFSTAYGHQSQIAVGCGQHVEQGQVIGYVGSTGHSTGPHLHFEIRIDGEAVDPLGYL
jgi:murein DD-endopeptidase MepM/ murein hydrolase activator NlpD